MQRAFWSIICFFIFINCKINAEITNRHSHSLVYVHIGPDLPSYLPIAIAQARLFNPDTPIYLIANSSAMSNYDCEDQKIHLVPIELLIPTKSHKKFKDRAKSNGFWRYTLERFLYLDDFIQQYKLNNVFHAENDVMIYFNLEEKLHVFQECYPKMIATTFDCDERSVTSFVYISDPMPSKQFAKYIAINGLNGANDMSLLFDFKEKYYKKTRNIAKKIEEGEKQVIEEVLSSPLALRYVLELGEKLSRREIRVREVIDDGDEELDYLEDEEVYEKRLLDQIAKLRRYAAPGVVPEAQKGRSGA